MRHKLIFSIFVLLSVCLLGMTPRGQVPGRGPAARRPSQLKLRLRRYTPGDDVELEVIVRGKYDLQIHYNGTWWGGGSGPPYATHGGEQYWMECRSGFGCTEWWRGDTGMKRGKIVIPLTTSTAGGKFPNAITASGTINGQSVSKSLTVRTF